MKNTEATVLHTMRASVIQKLWKLKASAIINATLNTAVETITYLKNQAKLLMLCFTWM